MSCRGLAFEIGKRFTNRAGSVIRITAIHPFKDYRFITGVIERMASGEGPELEYKITLDPCGCYRHPHGEHGLDLMHEVQALGKIAA
jgi:hypothetical protein